MKILFTILLHLPVISGFSQRQKLKESNFNPGKFKTYTLEIEPKKNEAMKLAYNSVTFADNRADSSKLGFIRTGEANEFFRFVFPDNTSSYLTARSNRLILKDSSGNGTILFSVKHFWIAQQIIKASLGKTILTGPKDYLSFCYLDLDCYLLKNDHLQLLGRIDTVISAKKWIGHYANELTKKSVTTAMLIADSLLTKSVEHSTENITPAELTAKYSLNYPILSGTPAKGIFLTYSDFLNNQPVSPEFTLNETKKEEVLISASVDSSKTNKAWGYFDGTDLFIHVNDEYYRMVRSQRTFEFAGPRNIRKIFSMNEKIFIATVGLFFGGLQTLGMDLLFFMSESSVMKELVPYQLNITDGTVY